MNKNFKSNETVNGKTHFQEGVSIIVPVYQSEKSLPELVSRLIQVLPGIWDSYEILLINDGSTDNSWAVICELAKQYSHAVKGICLIRNFGQHNAILCGLRQARYSVAVTVDDDLQNPPEEIPKLVAELKQGHDVIYGYPKEAKHSISRNIASHVTKFVLQSAMGSANARNISAFRVFRTELRDAFDHYGSAHVNLDVMLTWATNRFATIPVEHHSREYGQTTYTFRKLLRHALNMVTGFSTLPLRLASLVGFLFTLFGMGILFYVLGRYLISGSPVQGFPFLASIIAIFSGAQLFAMGMFGEYLARIYSTFLDRKAYHVRVTTQTQEHSDDTDASH